MNVNMNMLLQKIGAQSIEIDILRQENEELKAMVVQLTPEPEATPEKKPERKPAE